ncbi:unnamed protein product [Adineta ricciae]|uniref:Uncharacterized protein n=1 Tax=Adineta ricciae TaxID=249248 RepID=A0A814C685_ADIRI|nr:unnamed protein product [Adineta ricciae]CAF0936594.1 unnamed protein product [Adineta ricciae]
MNQDANQQQLTSDSTIDIHEVPVTEETPLTDFQENQDEGIQSVIPEALDWNTSMISGICHDGDLVRLRNFVEYKKQTFHCGRHAAEIADRLDADSGLSPLHHAARYQQLNICLTLLSNIAFASGVNIKDANHRTPLHSAFRSSSRNMNTNELGPEQQFQPESDFGDEIQSSEAWQRDYQNKILQSAHPLVCLFALVNADINACDKYLLTPLHYAVARNSLAGVKQLIELKANIEAKDRQDIRPLHLACKEGYLPIAEYLIEEGSQIDACDADLWTPLHYACSKGHLDIIKLYKSKARHDKFQQLIQMKTNTNMSCLHLAVQHDNMSIVEYILAEIDDDILKILINEEDESFGTPFHIAARFCDPSMLNLLDRYGADPLILNCQHQSALHIACASNRLTTVQELLLLTKESLLEIKDNHGHTALSVTTDLEIVRQLINHGANISSLNDNHMNVLMIAVSKDQLDIVDYLLSNIHDESHEIFHQVTLDNQRSIFLLAVQTGSIRMCSLLLAHPFIRWDTIDKQRMNAFHLAAQFNHYEFIGYFSKQIQNPNKLRALRSRTISMLRTPIDSDLTNPMQPSPVLRTYIDAHNEDGKTPLHLAAEYGHALCVDALLKNGADPLFPSYLGQLPLHSAIQNGFGQCVSLLLDACVRNKANFQSALARRQSPLITACQEGFAPIVRLLLEQEIEIIYDSDKEKKNPLEVAIEYRQIETIHALLDHPSAEQWLMSVRNTKGHSHQTPLRDMIRYMPECAKHAFDKLILKTDEVDANGNTFERITFVYKYIDDYFKNDDELYTTNGHLLYRNHPFIIALDTEHHSLLEHPLAEQLIARKWKLYRPFFYLTRTLSLLLLLAVTFYVLVVPARYANPKETRILTLNTSAILLLQRIIVILGLMNLFKIIMEIILFRGLRVPFAQIFSILSFLTAAIAFIPYDNRIEMFHWQMELAAVSVLLQWFNMVFILRSVPFVGFRIVMFQSVLVNFVSLSFVILPLIVAFTISTQMIFFNHPSFVRLRVSLHKISAMLIGEFTYETLFFSKPTLVAAASLLFVPFIIIMTIVFMNLLLGLAIGDIHTCMTNARAKAHAYRIRELVYIESTLPSIAWLKLNIVQEEYADTAVKNTTSKTDREESDAEYENYTQLSSNQLNPVELNKLLEVLIMLCAQAKQTLEQEVGYERLLKRLLTIAKVQSSNE